MPWFKRNPFFYTLLAILIAGVLGAMWMVAQKRKVLVALQDQYQQKSEQLDRLIVRVPSPTRGNLEALESNYGDLYEAYERALADLNLNTYDGDIFFGKTPQTKTDAFFEIARYVEDVRGMAANAGVLIDREERFGFGKYTNVGPEEEDIFIVHRQVKAMGFLLKELFASEISDFVAVQREDPAAVGALSAGTRVNGQRAGDIFQLDPKGSIRTNEVLNSMAFHVSFKSKSISMRNFINRIVSSELPFVVCSIKVETGDAGDSEYNRTQVAENPFANPDIGDQLIKAAQVPIISKNESTFSVTIEFLESVKTFEAPVAQDSRGEASDA